MRSALYVLLVFFLLVLPLSSAEIFITEDPESSYNVGDKVEFSFEIKSEINYRGPIEADLYCDEDFLENVFKTNVDFEENDSQEFDVFFFAEETDECYVEVVFDEADEEEQTDVFDVTDELDLEVSLNSYSFEPGETLKVNGSVEKELGDDFDYSILLVIDEVTEKRFSFSTEEFYLEYEFKENIEAGDYRIELEVTEKDLEDDIINDARFFETFEILSKPTSLTLVGDTVLMPPKDYSAVINILDQSGKIILGEEVYVRLEDPDGKFIEEKTINSGDNFEYSFLSIDSPREWTLRAMKGSFSSMKLITVEENEDILLELSGDNKSLIVRNVGNVLYDEILELELGNENNTFTETIPLNISVQNFATYKLKDFVNEFDQSYDLSFSDPSLQDVNFSSVFITGNVIGSGELVDYWPLGVVILVLIFIGGTITLLKKRSEKKGPKIKKEKKKKKLKNEKVTVPEVEEKKVVETNPVEENTERLYGLFFKEKVSKSLDDLLRKYGFSIHKLGEINFSVFKSKKKQEDKLVKLARAVNHKTTNKNILVHSTDFKKDPKIIKSFTKIKGVFASGEEGVFVTGNIYSKLEDKEGFEKVAAFDGMTIWRLKSN